ncbi:type II toxin-antitoxin system RelE/ParE family toxin [Methylocystis sp. B8]|uniref:type II toxin-antitoxin system RelE/ParE family toxin n=1 Tax=Methylocystis sp. B8 TaxID=544938 RepID=UPI0010FF3AB7|nr:type II toxin-antitoxin system RelE/ParE family toxin [Methylocystis sp. B8]TLG78924.1 type II toxin-antitoxin system RelE/ParE family toxin [Methylocystis sp. B8]
MKIIWAPEAIDDLAALRAYISQDNPAAARRLALHILELVETVLAENPHIGRPGRVPGTREFVVDKTPYVVPYRVKDKAVQILRVYHGARRWPESL